MEPNHSSAEEQSLISKIAFNGFFVLFTSLCTIIAVPLAIYFYRATLTHPEITFALNPARTTIVKAGQTSAIKIVYNQN